MTGSTAPRPARVPVVCPAPAGLRAQDDAGLAAGVAPQPPEQDDVGPKAVAARCRHPDEASATGASPATPHEQAEAAAVRERYARRPPQDPRYSLRDPAALLAWQERQRATVRLFDRVGVPDLAGLRLLEVGCGGGGNLLDALRLGFVPHHLGGIELLPERFDAARAVLPPDVRLWRGDATLLAIEASGWDIVLQSTVFSSLLDDAFQQRLADAMWRALRPGGGVLWHDFTVDNPRNADVRGVPLARLRALFPQAAAVQTRRITLAPPLARAVCRLHPGLYAAFNALPPLRTHLLAWLAKPAAAPITPSPAS